MQGKAVALIGFRESLQKSQKQMADLLDVSESFYLKIELGLRNPSYNFIKKFKEKFPGKKVDEIFFSKQSHVECTNDQLNPTGTCN